VFKGISQQGDRLTKSSFEDCLCLPFFYAHFNRLWAAKRAGFKTYYAPKAIAYHKIPEDPKEEAERLLSRAYFVARNRILFMKDFGKPTFWFFLPIYFFYYLRLALKYKRINAIINYLKGSINGILEN